MKTVFISYHFKDRSYKGEVVSWLQGAARTISVDESDLRPEGSETVKKRIRQDINASEIVLILVGNDTHNRPWIDYEVAYARSQGKPTYWVRLANRSGGAPEEVRSATPLRYDPVAIRNAVR